MRIVCPNCATAYAVDDTSLRPGRTARCARCQREWVPVSAVPALIEPPDRKLEASSLVRRRPRARVGLEPARVGWLATGLLILLVLWIAYADRAAIEHRWPPSVRLYTALGMARR